jgi:hypothetical protein
VTKTLPRTTDIIVNIFFFISMAAAASTRENSASTTGGAKSGHGLLIQTHMYIVLLTSSAGSMWSTAPFLGFLEYNWRRDGGGGVNGPYREAFFMCIVY